MFFVLSKVLWFVVQPVTVVFLLVLAFLLSWLRRRWLARFAMFLAAAVLSLCAFTTFGYVLLVPLEARFERPATPPAEVAGIIVLGGGMVTETFAVRGGYELNRSGDRFVEALRLAELYPEAKIVISGGSGALFPEGDTEAEAGARFFVDFGVDPARLIEEGGSRNTEENAQLTKATVQPKPGETWLLVTSAFHMPRSVGLFRMADFAVVPWPADRLSAGNEGFGLRLEEPAENLSIATTAIREWIGLIAYWLTGKIATPVPGPT